MAELLKNMNCVPCTGKEPALTDPEILFYQAQVPGWQVVTREGERRLERVFRFDDWTQALAFTDQVGKLAEENDHHPSILTEWGKVTVTWWTHKIHGLHRNDFVLAAKTGEASNQ